MRQPVVGMAPPVITIRWSTDERRAQTRDRQRACPRSPIAPLVNPPRLPPSAPARTRPEPARTRKRARDHPASEFRTRVLPETRPRPARDAWLAILRVRISDMVPSDFA